MVFHNISKAIKASKWLAIEYLNTEDKVTKYWIAIKDINIDSKTFVVDAFNVTKINNNSNGVIEIDYLYADKIKSAYVLDNTSYNQPEELIEKINININKLDWLAYDFYNDNILDYIHEVMKHDEVPFQTDTTLVSGIDEDTLKTNLNNNLYELSLEQITELVRGIESKAKRDEKKRTETSILALNLLSIKTKQGLFVVAYKELVFNPLKKALVLLEDINFNYEFKSEEFKDYKHNLRNYLDIETEDFTNLYLNDSNAAKNMLMNEVRRFNESLDDRPYIFDLKRSYYMHIEKEITKIKNYKKNNEFTVPLHAFFGNMSRDKIKRKRHVDVVVLDDKANIDQLRVIYNSLVQPITYVQGPPGTGKTQTIINTLISSLFNKQTVLVSSNNNKPITDIYNKLMSLKNRGKIIPLPFIRLGNNSEVLNTLEYLKSILYKYNNFTSDDKMLNNHATNKKEKMRVVNKLIEDYELRLELTEEIDALNSFRNNIKGSFRSEIVIHSLLEEKTKKLNEIPYVKEDSIKDLIIKADYAFMSWLFFTSVKHLKRLHEPKNSELLEIIKSEDKEEKVRAFNKYTSSDSNMKNLLKIFPIILTTNQSSYRLGKDKETFDLCIIDEAGQSSIGPSLFSIIRASRLLLVGDQNQLKPVLSVAPETNKILMKKYNIGPSYNYLDNSILLSMQKMDTISKFVLLRYHYRSRKDIINFSNKKYYKGQLKLPLKDNSNTHALEYIDVDTSSYTKNQIKNISVNEITAIISSIKSSNEKDIGIITPFRNQSELIKAMLKEHNLVNIDVGTVHTFQGDEKNTIYFSSGISKNSFDKTFDWVKNNEELINVATTRAKNKFVLVADYNEIKKRSVINNDFNELSMYVKNRGKEVVLSESNNTEFINGYNFRGFNSIKEQEFIDTINHLLTINNKYYTHSKVRVASILDKFTNPIKYDYGLKAEFDLVIFKKINNLEIPVVAIELDGSEHYNDPKVIRRDKLKEEIARDNGLKIIRVNNDYSRRYVHIKDILLEIIK